MALQIKIISVGKTKDEWLKLALAEYESRLQGSLKIDWQLFKTEEDFENACRLEKNYFCLDLTGKELSSEAFAKDIFSLFGQWGTKLSFVIGPSDGLSSTILKGATGAYCLSKMTFTHQMARLILVEQLYRAVQIEKGSKYHK